MELKDEEKKFEEKCQEVQDKLMRQNILFIFNKTNSKKYSEYTINISIPNNESPKSKEDYEFILYINLTRKKIILFSTNINPISDGRNLLPIINLNTSNRVKLNFISNKEKLCSHIEVFQQKMEEFRRAIKDENSEKLKALLEDTRQKRMRMGAICSVKS